MRLRLRYLLLGDLLFCVLALLLSLWVRQPHLLNSENIPRVIMGFAPTFLLWIVTFYSLGLYDLRLLRSMVSVVNNTLVAFLVNGVLATMYFYLVSPYLDLKPKTILFMALLAAHLGAFVWRRVWLEMLRSRLFTQKVLFLAEQETADEFAKELGEHPAFGFASVKNAAAEPDLYIVEKPWLDRHWGEASKLFRDAVLKNTPVVTLDAFYEFIFGKVLAEHVNSPYWLLEHALPRSGMLYPRIKRILDICFCLLLLMAGSPVLALIAVLIRVLDGSPILYGQPRLGFLGKKFVLWKFRTMTVGADRAGAFTSHNATDIRITRLGKFLRRFRLDELPQLWNVLRGEMTLVGPRPEWMREVEVLEKTIPQYHLRHLVKPGITGWAQVYFRATNSPQDSLQKLRYDLFYIKHLSLALDLSILLKTLKRIVISDFDLPALAQGNTSRPVDINRAVPAPLGDMFGR